MTTERPAGLWSVTDSNAREKRRIHDLPGGKRYALDAVEPTFMPKSDAVIFMRDASFVVRDDNDAIQKALPASEAAGERKARELDPDECIARYDELLKTALEARAATRPGYADLGPDPDRAELIAFLKSAPAKRDARPEEKARASEGLDDSIDPENAAMGKLKSMDELLAGV